MALLTHRPPPHHSTTPSLPFTQIVEQTIKKDGDDLTVTLYIKVRERETAQLQPSGTTHHSPPLPPLPPLTKGTFHETHELYDFPFDTQPLHISLCINCRKTGPMPIRFRVNHARSGGGGEQNQHHQTTDCR